MVCRPCLFYCIGKMEGRVDFYTLAARGMSRLSNAVDRNTRMKLRKIEFAGFRTFAESTKFDFGSVPGLYFLEGGDNAVDPSLGSNGVGKSTVWSALCWILFGRTADGLKAEDLKSWQSEEKGYYGKLWIGRSLVVRKWRPNKLTLDGEVIEQSALEEALGINFQTFTSAVVLSQGGDMFFDLQPARKLALFTAMLKLDNWTNYSAVAKSAADGVQDEVHTLERNISRLEGKLDGLDIEDLQAKRKDWRRKKTTLEKTLRREIKGANKEASALLKALDNAKARKKELGAEVRLEKGAEALAFENWTEASAEEEKVVWATAQLKKQITADHAHRQQVSKTKKGLCRHCGQKISKDRLALHIKALDEALDEQRGTLTFMATECNRLEATKDMYSVELQAAKKRLRQTSKALSRVKDDVASFSTDAARAVTALESKQGRLDASYKDKNPFIPLIREREAEEERLSGKLKRKEKQHGLKQKEKADVLYWVQGFKDVRLFLIEEALVQLEIETNKALSDLGFTSDWRIRYSIDKRSKAGHAISGFSVAVQSPNSSRPVPFAAWSGGEKQRLKIAGSIGFIALMSARTGLELGIEVYDEPTQHLSPQGIDNLLETLRQRALETGRRIWLVDHHTLDYGDFAGRAIVSKETGGSTLWQN